MSTQQQLAHKCLTLKKYQVLHSHNSNQHDTFNAQQMAISAPIYLVVFNPQQTATSTSPALNDVTSSTPERKQKQLASTPIPKNANNSAHQPACSDEFRRNSPSHGRGAFNVEPFWGQIHFKNSKQYCAPNST